jgi:site-specific DNA recombinase
VSGADKALRAALYARFSTENQRKESVDDQFRECQAVADREGLIVVAKYQDEGISGGTAKRAGYQAMLTAARGAEFDILISEDVSRLWRSRAEFGPRSAELEDLGIHWISCVGQDTRRDGWGLVIQILQAMGEQQRREASYRTRRGLRGKALAGKSTGGRAYGFTSIDDPSGERNKDGTAVKIRVVNEDQAKVVRQIYEWRAAGWSGQRIARQLNEDKVPPPGATWQRVNTGPNRKNTSQGWTHSAIVGDPKKGVGILNNPIYKGEVVWGRTEWTPQAKDSSQRIVKLKHDGWVTRTDKTLQVVTPELWDQVHAIQTMSNPRREAVRLGVKRRHTRFRSRYWLSGTLVCGVCGSNYVADGRLDWMCPAHTSNHCSNDLRFRRDEIQDAVFALLSEHLTSATTIANGRKAIEAQLQEEHAREQQTLTAAADSAAMSKLDEQARALKRMNLPPAVLHAALSASEREREELLAAAAKKASAPTERAKRLLSRLPEITASYQKLVACGARVLAEPADVAEAGEALRTMLIDGRITLVPNAEHTAVIGPVHFKGLGDYVLEMAGCQRRVRDRKPNEIKKKLIGSGGRI